MGSEQATPWSGQQEAQAAREQEAKWWQDYAEKFVADHMADRDAEAHREAAERAQADAVFRRQPEDRAAEEGPMAPYEEEWAAELDTKKRRIQCKFGLFWDFVC